MASVTVSAPPSGSVSLASTSIVTLPPEVATAAVSSPATGGSFGTGSTPTVTRPSAVLPASSLTV